MTVSFDFNFWTVLMFLMNFGVVAWVQISNRSKAATEELKAVQKSAASETKTLEEKAMHWLGQHSERISALEMAAENAIKHDDLAAVHRRVDGLMTQLSRMEGQVGQMAGQVTQVLTNLDRLTGLMMHQGSKL
ncbi:conserved protein of unknown function [Methylococcus capsulatus]|uniref:DUF2730 family protein n=1 Tax=Methylococcus capsulatus TaxID=414 RepID=A0AA35UG22_METCP|nr:hypothetical protein [Methylococcus capsulatus]CAI8742309.1 conserved protein of unknown function [Methylococcus capsulatus]